MRSFVCSNPPTGLALLNTSFQPHGVTRSSQFARFRSFRLRAGSFDEFEDPLEVENIDREYCNDFVCNSSPLVEETVKMFAVDLQRPGRWTLNRFPENVIYQVTLSHSFSNQWPAFQDAFRSFKGKDKYRRFSWIKDCVTKPRIVRISLF